LKQRIKIAVNPPKTYSCACSGLGTQALTKSFFRPAGLKKRKYTVANMGYGKDSKTKKMKKYRLLLRFRAKIATKQRLCTFFT
jgi:hypothetical protein